MAAIGHVRKVDARGGRRQCVWRRGTDSIGNGDVVYAAGYAGTRGTAAKVEDGGAHVGVSTADGDRAGICVCAIRAAVSGGNGTVDRNSGGDVDLDRYAAADQVGVPVVVSVRQTSGSVGSLWSVMCQPPSMRTIRGVEG